MYREILGHIRTMENHMGTKRTNKWELNLYGANNYPGFLGYLEGQQGLGSILVTPTSHVVTPITE